MKNINLNETDQLINDLKKLVDDYNKLKKLAETFKLSPGKVIDIIGLLGNTILTNASDNLVNEVKERLYIFKETAGREIPIDISNALDSLINFMKVNEAKK
ncbi:MAG: hypothetical protein IPM51_12150 [Sphingobacteriaceae bacterium]|nr:hypothetical protein [Sphingobacteriaceae bacterium]